MLMGDQPLVPSMGNKATKRKLSVGIYVLVACLIMIQPRLSPAQEFSIQDLQLLAQFLPLFSQRAMSRFYWTSNLFSIVSGCPLLFWSSNLILADTVLS